jgi:hypothetical protein
MKRIETLGELLIVWRSLAERFRVDFTIGRRFASDPTGTLRQYGYELAPEVHSAVLQAVR